jgi:hypothetical protein
MEPLNVKRYGNDGPEALIQRDIIIMLKQKNWYVKRMVGNAFQFGVPDLYATHKIWGPRWIEVKLPGMKGSRFTNAQLEDFPLICANGHGVWVLTAATAKEYDKLKQPPNWYQYLKVMG